MKTRTGIYAALTIASAVFLYTACERRANNATETSATGRISDESTNTDANTESETPVKLKEYVTGDWTTDAASGNGANASRITFTREGKYLRYAGNQRADSGLYRVNEAQKILYLEPGGSGDPTEWKVTINDNNQMTVVSRDAKNQKSNSFTYRRN